MCVCVCVVKGVKGPSIKDSFLSVASPDPISSCAPGGTGQEAIQIVLMFNGGRWTVEFTWGGFLFQSDLFLISWLPYLGRTPCNVGGSLAVAHQPLQAMETASGSIAGTLQPSSLSLQALYLTMGVDSQGIPFLTFQRGLLVWNWYMCARWINTQCWTCFYVYEAPIATHPISQRRVY